VDCGLESWVMLKFGARNERPRVKSRGALQSATKQVRTIALSAAGVMGFEGSIWGSRDGYLRVVRLTREL